MMAAHRLMMTALIAACAVAPFPPREAAAQAYPNRLIRMIVPFAPGGNADINARIVAEIIQTALGQPVVVENRAGAGGNIGAEAVVRAEPDGYTILGGSSGPLTINPNISANVTYDPLTDFAPVALTSYTPHVLIMGNTGGLRSVADVLALAKKRPVTLSTSGLGSATHLTIERFKPLTGADITHVPYRSGAALLPDVISGNVDGAMTEMSSSLEMHKGGQARIIAVATVGRTKLAADIPTFDEQGVKGFTGQSFGGVLAPAKTPPDIIAKLQQAIAQGLAPGSPSAAKLIAIGAEIATPEQMTPTGFAAFLKAEFESLRAAAKLAGLSPK